MLIRIVAAAAIVSLAGTAGIRAEDAEGRYALEKTADGFVRMDRRTGEMSICTERAGQLVCRLAADERSALQDEIARLQGSITRIEDRLAALEGAGGLPKVEMFSEEEFDKTMGYVERFLRRFMDMAREFGGKPGETVPEKT